MPVECPFKTVTLWATAILSSFDEQIISLCLVWNFRWLIPWHTHSFKMSFGTTGKFKCLILIYLVFNGMKECLHFLESEARVSSTDCNLNFLSNNCCDSEGSEDHFIQSTESRTNAFDWRRNRLPCLNILSWNVPQQNSRNIEN